MEKERKTICFLPNRLILGGIEKVLVDALNVLHGKYDIDVILFADDTDPMILDAIPSDVRVIYRPLPKNKIIRQIARIPCLSYLLYDKAIGKKKYDFLVTLRPSVFLTAFSKKAKHKIFWLHGDFNSIYTEKKTAFGRFLSNMYLRHVYKQYGMIWTVCDTIKEDMEKRLKLKNIHTLSNPANCTEIYRKAEEDCDLAFDKSKTNIVLIGRLSREKGFSRVIKIMADSVFKEHPDTHLYIIGDGNIAAYQGRVDKYGCSDRISFLGPKDNPFPYLKQAQLLMCPSYHESFGLAIIEAMLLRVPVITTDTAGGRFLTQSNTLAYCVKNDDSSIKKALDEFLGNKENYPYSLDAAQKWAECFDLKVFENNINALMSGFEE